MVVFNLPRDEKRGELINKTMKSRSDVFTFMEEVLTHVSNQV